MLNKKLGSIFGFFIAACTPKHPGVSQVTPQEAYGSLKNGFAILVDVREQEEVRDGMAESAVWVPTSKIEARDVSWTQFVDKLPKDKQIIFYCAAGVRAGRAAAELAEKGYKTGNMGGYSSWLKAGLPIKKP